MENEIRSLNDYQKAFNRESALAIKWIYKIQHWKARDLENRIPGVPRSVWRAYGQQGYSSARSLHICAALSWVTQISMSAFYYGNRIKEFWPDVDIDVIQCIVYSGLLPKELFKYLVDQLMLKTESIGNMNREEVNNTLGRLAKYNNEDFLMPTVLDIEAFKEDYYRSVAINMRKFRCENNLKEEQTASVLNIPVGKYISIEDPDKPISIPLYAAMRLKLGFKISDTVSFTDHMRKFKAFSTARNIQQLRETVIISLMRSVDTQLRRKFVSLAREIMRFHQP